ncbi:hypothetical protein DEO72_LG8g914 [Vigna unguiculata]|uniref:Uncharacterized protein n=1 Tax=Vigna unguiculata TaxID=3917 RepID=A0A4D6MPE4_VIGUN|nr:hypothetical protein DEO72_LG8g914 [Vigna unguiculata]
MQVVGYLLNSHPPGQRYTCETQESLEFRGNELLNGIKSKVGRESVTVVGVCR